MTTSKSGAFTVVYQESKTTVDVSQGPNSWTALTPFTVTSGTFSGLAPRLLVTIDD